VPVEAISHFKGEFDFLSNFHASEVQLGRFTCPTVEHAFQAAKTWDLEERTRIVEALTPGKAKRLGRECTIRKDWDEIVSGRPTKEWVMIYLLRQKFYRHPELSHQLAMTLPRPLIEGNNWHDTYWGVCSGQCRSSHEPHGRNRLGALLEQVRAEIWCVFGKRYGT
jgi:ribA/ribD-fused uncharacterized protein